MSIHAQTQLGSVALTVQNLDRSLAFYQQVVGLKVHWHKANQAGLGVGGGELLLLTEFPAGRPANHYPGLYHFALLVPTRPDLARVLIHLAQSGVELGASDHLVSEALYLNDPDGHGIEIYADRPRSKWPLLNGQIQMATKALQVDNLLAEVEKDPHWAGLPAGTIMGHVHLQVADIPQAKRFYTGVLGFDPIVDYGAMATFVSAGGYHHHLGLNTWHSAGAKPAPAEVLGLQQFTLVLPHAQALTELVQHIQSQNYPLTSNEQGYFMRDPFGIGLQLTAAG